MLLRGDKLSAVLASERDTVMRDPELDPSIGYTLDEWVDRAEELEERSRAVDVLLDLLDCEEAKLALTVEELVERSKIVDALVEEVDASRKGDPALTANEGLFVVDALGTLLDELGDVLGVSVSRRRHLRTLRERLRDLGDVLESSQALAEAVSAFARSVEGAGDA